MELERRRFLTLLATGSAVVLAGCSSFASTASAPTSSAPTTGTTAPPPTTDPTPTLPPLPPVPGPNPGPAQLIYALPDAASTAIALTVDDGSDAETVAAYVQFATDSGLPLTFNPSGTWAGEWAPHAAALAPLIARGQVQIGNHTWTHADLTELSDSGVQAELEQNEEWIQATFGITSRPWYRPPFGYRNAHTDAVAAEIGFTHTAMWNGTLGDSALLTEDVLLDQADQYVTGGTLLLGHANHPTVTHVYDQLVELIRSRELTPLTLDAAFGTSRAAG